MDAYIGEIRIVPWNVLPNGWVQCSGQVLQVGQYQALFSLIGNMYGGDGRTTFNLPNLNGRVIVGCNPYPVGSTGGATKVTLDQTTVPSHQHEFQVSSNPGTSNLLAGNVCASVATGQMLYGSMANNVTPMSNGIVDSVGGGQPHSNMQPYMALKYIICVTGGYYPPRAD